MPKILAVALATASMLVAQSAPASITTISVPTYGQAFFDAAGNQYYMQGPVTPGAAQTQPGDGYCDFPGGFIGPGVIVETCTDAQIVKLDPSGNVVFGTYLGGPTNDGGRALAIDSSGNVFITGYTGGQFPTTPGSAIPSSTTANAFAARLSSDGSTFAHVTYLPDTITRTTAIALDSADNAYITGQTGTGAAAVIKLSPDGSAIFYNITLAPDSLGTAIAIDPSGNAIVAGATGATNFPVTSNAIQSSLNGPSNLFLAKLDPSGNILYATYLGGSGIDNPTQLQLDSSGNIYVAGYTSSLDFPTTPGTLQPTPIVPVWNYSAPAGFAAKIAPSAGTLVWSTFVPSIDQGAQGIQQMAIAPSGSDVYLAGLTGGTFPITGSAPEPCFSNSAAGFVAHLNSQGALADATYINDPPQYSPVNGILGLGMATGSSVEAIWQYSGTNDSSIVQFGAAGYTAPACLSTSILNGASQYGDSTTGIAPTEIITLTGFGMGPATGVAAQANAQGAYPTELAGVQVLFDGTPAPLLYAQSEQINVVTPASFVNSAYANIQVTYNRQQLPNIAVPIVAANPGIFRAQPGVSALAYATNQDGALNGPDHPAAPGSVVTLLTTGYGPTSPACTPGGPNVPYLTGLAPGVPAQINGATVTYAGSAPGYACGVQQVDFTIPSTAAAGSLFLKATAGNSVAASDSETTIGATIFVGQP